MKSAVMCLGDRDRCFIPNVAYPSYSWQLLFQDRKFAGLIGGLDLADSTRFSPHGRNTFFIAVVAHHLLPDAPQ
ncbi:MAG: hypothetical protein HDR90_08790 [Bacteroides sp.]|nr:hypothetical protein [Bacteroides sp.]